MAESLVFPHPKLFFLVSLFFVAVKIDPYSLFKIIIKYVKVAVNRKLQKFMHGLFNLVVHIELYMHNFSVLYYRASLTLLPQQITKQYYVSKQRYSVE